MGENSQAYVMPCLKRIVALYEMHCMHLSTCIDCKRAILFNQEGKRIYQHN